MGIVWGVENVCVCVTIMYLEVGVDGRNDHTIMTAPLPVCSAKLSMSVVLYHLSFVSILFRLTVRLAFDEID